MEGVAEASMHFQDSMSVLGIFAGGGLVVKLVILILAFFSLVSWAVIFKKSWTLKKIHREIKDLEVILSSQNIAPCVREIVECGTGVVSQILRHGVENAKLITNKKEGFHRFIRAELGRSTHKLEEQLELLSVAGAASLPIGLFGAIWSVIENLKVLPPAQSGSIDVATLYPFIAEILYPVALGLAVSIPANIFHRKFTASACAIYNRLKGLVYEIGVFVADDEC